MVLNVNDVNDDNNNNNSSNNSPTHNLIFLKQDSKGNAISQTKSSSNKLSDYIKTAIIPINNTATTILYEEAIKGREQIISILQDSGIIIDETQVESILQLPTWEQVTNLYYKGNNNNASGPIIIGLDRCAEFRSNVPLEQRFIGVAGNFNSGTTAFGISLQSNCEFPTSRENQDQREYHSNDVVSNVNGMLNQVPWAKHKMAYHRSNHTIISTIPKHNVLPVVLIRDPYYWMQSMCKEGYGVRWDHSTQHCPNLVPYTEFDKRKVQLRRRQQQQRQQMDTYSNYTTRPESIPVWMGKNIQSGVSWDSLIHYWNEWYESYVNVNYPRLIIRFEDTLYYPTQVMEQVCVCGGATPQQPHKYLVSEAKYNHKQQQNNLVSAIIKYGTNKTRYNNLTNYDIKFMQQHVNSTVMKLFQYDH
jgi:hypothetical protein